MSSSLTLLLDSGEGKDMKLVHNIESLKERRRELRKSATKAEDILWQAVRRNQLGFRFHRQYSIGGYILDFYCPKKRLIVEVDGPIHELNREYDIQRDKYFIDLDYKVIRFKNEEVENNLESVIHTIICLL